MNLVLFPNQLYDPELLRKRYPDIEQIIFVEDPVFYGDRKGSCTTVQVLKLNKLRILFCKVLHKQYVETLNIYFKVKHIEIDDLWNNIDYSFLPEDCTIIDPCDLLLMKRLRKYGVRCKVIDNNPSFIFTNQELQEYMKDRQNKHLQHNHFYNVSKKKLGILENVPSQDIYNRKQYSKNIEYPKNPYRNVFSEESIWLDALTWLNETSPFRNNYGPSKEWKLIINDYLIHLPLTHKDVKVWLNDFIKNRLDTYGSFQDVVIPDNPLLYHSGLSIYLNNGMITPYEIVRTVMKQNSPIQNIEGFVRQVIGWREYARLYYLYVSSDVYRKNIFGIKKKSLAKKWYTGKTDIPIVNDTIKYAFNYGYINHIQRLMVMANYMTINEIHPDNIYKWMYEFSLDSYDWVMIFNSYSMGSWSDKGHAMRKPYISSSSYVLRMSSAKKGEWTTVWDDKFKSFIQKNKQIIKHTQLANLVK